MLQAQFVLLKVLCALPLEIIDRRSATVSMKGSRTLRLYVWMVGNWCLMVSANGPITRHLVSGGVEY